MAKKQAPQQPMQHHEMVSQDAAYGMSQQPANEVGLQGHFAHLNESFLVGQPYWPGEIAPPAPAPRKR